MIFIIGTDTDVGKTYYGQSLVRKGYHVIKPIETGFSSFEDPAQSDTYGYAQLSGKPLNQINLYFFNEPASPHLAAEMEDTTIDISAVIEFIKNSGADYVELAGGLMVPITREFTQLDLIKSFDDAKVDLVVGNQLGCINHTLLTLEVLKKAHVKVNDVIINTKVESVITKDNEMIIQKYIKKVLSSR